MHEIILIFCDLLILEYKAKQSQSLFANMELSSSNIWNLQTISSSTGGVLFVAGLVFASLATTLYYAISTLKEQKVERGHPPPYAPGTRWSHLKKRMSPKSAYWLLDMGRQLNTRLFRVALPTIPLRSLTAVGETAPFRELLMDSQSIKPTMYGYFRGVYMGTETVFTSNGSGWHSMRKAVAPAFSSKHIRRMTTVALEKTEDWIKNRLEQNYSFDVSKEMIGIVLSALSETALEYDMTEQEKEMFGKELRLALIEYTRKTPMIPLRKYFGWLIPERRRAVEATRRLNDLVVKIMAAYRGEDTSRCDGTIIQLIMESDAFPTDREKAAQLLEFLVAGHDTTAYSIAFILIELAKNPQEQIKLRESLSQLTPENWRNSSYLQNVVKEGMRLHPVGRSLRIPGKDIKASKNVVIPKGSTCVAHFMLLFRNPDIFEDPESFIPSRWEHPTQEMNDAFNPFSLGKQNCLGQSLAKAEVIGIVARICSEYELWVECEGSIDFFLTVKPVGARLRARKVKPIDLP